MAPKDYERLLREKKARSTLEALFRAARLVNEHAIERSRSRQRAGPPIRTSHTTLFPHIDLEGTRITTLAERVGTSKQAVSELVEELDQMGVVERIPDPTDGRAKLVVFSKKGGDALLDGLELLYDVEAELSESIGKRKILALRGTLHEIIELLAPCQ